MANQTLAPEDTLYYHRKPARSGLNIIICICIIILYELILKSTAHHLEPRPQLKGAVWFCLLNPVSWYLYYLLSLMVRNASWTLTIRENVLGWTAPRLLGGETIHEIELGQVKRIQMAHGEEKKSLVIFLNDGERVDVPALYLKEMDQLEQVLRAHFPETEIETKS